MSAFYLTRANAGDDPEINRLLKQRPMGRLLRISLERAPSPGAAARVEGYRQDTILIRDSSNDSIVGMGNRSVRRVYYNGEICRLGYLGQLRAAPGRHGLKRLAAGYEGVKATRSSAELPFDLTSIVDDNLQAKRLLEKGLKVLPSYKSLANYSTFILPSTGKSVPDSTATANREDLADILTLLNHYNRGYQFAPVYNEQELMSSTRSPNLNIEDFLVIREAGKIVACAALWDQRPFKQTVVQGYVGWLKLMRPLINLGRSCIGKPLYAKAPYVVPMAFLSHFAMPNVNPAHLSALLQKAKQLAQKRNIQYLAIGFAENHPCHELVARSFRHQQFSTTLYSVHWPDQTPVPEQALKRLVPHPEVALL